MKGCGTLKELQAGGAELGSTASKLPTDEEWEGWARDILGMKAAAPPAARSHLLNRASRVPPASDAGVAAGARGAACDGGSCCGMAHYPVAGTHRPPSTIRVRASL
jgi:hypothetical protein